ncbi:hypothetical protein B9T66_08195 [Helicobacter sp. TUL]|nr:hypothetical protein B9T66_08195 [Helicobacter sp. TUL]
MLIYLFLLILIPTILSYLILTFIYRILFKSKKKVSKFLVFLGSIGLIIFYYTPYSYYLEPSFHKFKEICQLDPEIYQANGGKLDGAYYNSILKYFNTDMDSLDYNKFQETTTLNFQQQKPPYKKMKVADKNLYLYYPLEILYDADIPNRISLGVSIVFNNDKPKNKQDIERMSIRPEWQTFRIKGIKWDIATSGDFRMPTKILDCDYFKKGIDNEKQRDN